MAEWLGRNIDGYLSSEWKRANLNEKVEGRVRVLGRCGRVGEEKNQRFGRAKGRAKTVG